MRRSNRPIVPAPTHALDRERARHVLCVPCVFRTGQDLVAGVSLDSLSGADRVGLKQLYERYWTDLCRHIRATFGTGAADPQDVAQSAFARYLSMDDRQAVENPRAFLYTTARNIALDITRHLKHTHRHVVEAAADETVDEFSPERIALARERAAALSAVIEKLPRKQRQALLLNRLHDLSYSEIAERTGSSKSDVRRQIVRALATIEAALGESE
jgi:RNA polymerase sigma factor (sigma-70 family)